MPWKHTFTWGALPALLIRVLCNSLSLPSSSSVVRQLCGDGTAISEDACFGMVGMIGIAWAESKRTCPKLFTGYSQWAHQAQCEPTQNDRTCLYFRSCGA